MKLFPCTSGYVLDDVHLLLPQTLIRAASMDADLGRNWTFTPKPTDKPGSPAQALLGVVGPGPDLAGRVLDFAMFGGADWVRLAAPAPGRQVVDTITGKLARRDPDIRAIVSVAAQDENVLDSLAQLDRLLRSAVRPAVNYEGSSENLFFGALGVESADLVALAAWEVVAAVAGGRRWVECAHCHRLFLPAERTDESYCRRSAPGETAGGRTCHQVGPGAVYAANLSPLGNVYRLTYKRLETRSRRGKFPREELDRWREQARELVDVAQRRTWSEDRLQAALDKIAPKGKDKQ